MPALKHTHKYVRISPRRKNHFHCVHPKCTSWAPKQLIKGKYGICNGCEEEFIMDAVSLTRAKPKCKRCRGEIRETPNEIDKFISEVL